MNTQFRWKKKFFSRSYKIYSGNQILGKLESRFFSRLSRAKLKGQKYLFRTKGLLRQTTTIYNGSENSRLGTIKYTLWSASADINLAEKEYRWMYNNFRYTMWSITGSDGVNIKYSRSFTKGQIQGNTDDPVLLFTGLFIHGYLSMVTMIYVLLFILIVINWIII
ncbi:MAG: hypothetical protein GF372_12395 [Candidatus Marinimicrobia bacterium]|nr:hypothetical protein [Candidatus Neomarinimicrobiota bacterium]